MMRVRRIVTYAAIALALLMLLGSCDYKTRRETESSAADAATSATDGFDEWAWLPALSALVAIVLLGNVAAMLARRTILPRQAATRAAWLAALALGLFVVGANAAGRYWMSVLAEQKTADYAVSIAFGLPTVTATGAIGAVVCLLLVVSLLVSGSRREASS